MEKQANRYFGMLCIYHPFLYQGNCHGAEHTKAAVFFIPVEDDMTAGNGKPCRKCGTSEWYDDGGCKECKRVRGKKWQEDNFEKYKTRKAKWQQDNRKKVKTSNDKWYATNREKKKKISIGWQRANPDKKKAIDSRRRTRKTEAGGSFTGAEWRKLCRQYGNRCLGCGKKEKLTADHIVPVSMGGSSNINNIQPLCQSCNSSKGATVKDYRISA